VSALSRLVARERACRTKEFWQRIIVRSAAEEAELDAAIADGRVHGNIVRRIVTPPPCPADQIAEKL
jgi:hypothetical protein